MTFIFLYKLSLIPQMLNQKAEVAGAVILAWIWGFGESLNLCASLASPPKSLGFLLVFLCPEHFSAVSPSPARPAGKMQNLIIIIFQLNQSPDENKADLCPECKSLLFQTLH